MAKLTITLFKKHLSTLNEVQLRLALEALYSKIPQVREFYAKQQGVEAPAKKAPNPKFIEEYQQKIYNQFWTKTGNPRNSTSNVKIRAYILDFEKKGFLPKEVIALILYRVEMATICADQYGGMRDSSYNASVNAFARAVKMIDKEGLREEFADKCAEIFEYQNLDGWYIENLKEIWEEGQEERKEEEEDDDEEEEEEE